MYEAHFGFHRQPFQSADACRAFFISESIREILPQLLHALRSDLGIAVLTGVPGSGKTTLLRHIQQQLSKAGRVIVCSGANLGTSADFVGALLQASRLTGGAETTTKPAAIEHAIPGSRSSALDFMKRTAELWGPVLMLIDDVQLVPLPVLNELRACTEEEWNGRDLIRCLVSAPITFEDQLARHEYADFARRIRCHAFLQPLKSSESFIFLKEQIEVAGGRISNVFTTNALESITAAAGGNPRCLGLLADETLVVAAMVDEKIASEKSVRTALSRLQHLQYNWNTSPNEENVEERAELDFEPTHIDAKPTETEKTTASISSVISDRISPAATAFNAPIQATIAPGIIEFGGRSISTTRSILETSSGTVTPPAANKQIPLAEDHSDFVDVSGCIELPMHLLPAELTEQVDGTCTSTTSPRVSFNERIFSDIHESTPRNTVLEFGASEPEFEAMSPPAAIKTGHLIPEFEVGQRFVSESTQESISIDDVEDRDILELLNFGTELNLVDVASRSLKAPSAAELVESPEARIVWLNENSDANESPTPVETNSVTITPDDNSTSPSMADDFPVDTTPRLSESQNEGSEPESENVNAGGKFFDATRAKLSNRLPVFDRYTWLALGREVPAGRSSAVCMSVTRQLIQADYARQPFGRRTTVSALSTSLQHANSIDRIAISLTTDAALSEEIARNSLNAQSGVYLAITSEDSVVAEISTTRQPADSMLVAASQDETHNIETHNIDSSAGSNEETAKDSADAQPHSNSGLRIWRDGMLVFSNGKTTDEIDAQDPPVLSHKLNTSAHQATATPHAESSAQSSPPDESFLSRNKLQLNAGGFFTLPDSRPQHVDALSSLKISEDEDVYPFVEAINSMRADVRSFQDTGSAPSEDSDSVSRFPESDDSATQTDNVLSRAKRRLDDRTISADTETMALEISLEVRRQQKTASETESVSASDSTLNSEPAPKFGSLFTRLRESRKRAADQSRADA